MARSSDPRKQYLKPRGGKWFLNFPIPKDLRSCYPTASGSERDHIVIATGESDLNEAHRKKFGMIQLVQLEFTRMRQQINGITPQDVTLAKAFSEEIKKAAKAHDYATVGTLQMLVTDEAARIDSKHGSTPASLERARAFVSITEGQQTLVEAFDEWVANGTLPERTRAKYRTALDEFIGFLGGVVTVANMTRENALRYTDWLNKEARSQRTKKLVPLSYNTKRDRVMALSAFWNLGLHQRGKTKDQHNPWSRLVITEKPTSSDIEWDSTENMGKPKLRDSFEAADLVAIFDAAGPREGRNNRYTKRQLMEVFSLAILTGARPNEICSLSLGDIKLAEGVAWLDFKETKTGDDRKIPVVHPIAMGIIKRRIGDRTGAKEQLFAELRTKGKKGTNLYDLIGNALNRHLDRATGLDTAAVPYAARHTFTTVVGNMEGIQDHALKRYIGHTPAGMTDKHYRSVKPENLLAVARKVQYPAEVEKRMQAEVGLG